MTAKTLSDLTRDQRRRVDALAAARTTLGADPVEDTLVRTADYILYGLHPALPEVGDEATGYRHLEATGPDGAADAVEGAAHVGLDGLPPAEELGPVGVALAEQLTNARNLDNI